MTIGRPKQRTQLSKKAKKDLAIAASDISCPKKRLDFLLQEAPRDFLGVKDGLKKIANWGKEGDSEKNGRPCSYGDLVDSYLAKQVQDIIDMGNIGQLNIDVLRYMLEKLCQTFHGAFSLNHCGVLYDKGWGEKFAARYKLPSIIAKVAGTSLSKSAR